MKCLIIIAISIFISNTINAQGIKGKITDSKKQPIPFATIYIENLQSGTTANLNGEFEIKCNPGTYMVIFRALGFKMRKQEIGINDQFVTLAISLETEIYQMKEVVISNKREDPAYAIMRKAIAYAPYHLKEVDHHNANVYLKGTLYVDKMPKILQKYTKVQMNGEEYTIKTGDVYVEESVIDIEFNAPQFYKRKIRSIHSSFPGENQNPVNPVMTIESSFYQPEVISAISPLSPLAFQHYKFKYLGFFEDGESIVDKIEVIPRRKSQDLFQGFIFIIEGRWCLHSIDLTNNQFWGSLNIKEIFGIVDKKAWMPVSYSFSAQAKMMGVKVRYKYASSVKYSNVRINEKLAAKYGLKSGGSTNDQKQDKTIQALVKDNLTNREMKKIAKTINKNSQYQQSDTLTTAKFLELNKRETDSLATNRDTNYWANFRPAPLTAEEIKSFNEGPQAVLQKIKRDSIHHKTDSTSTVKKSSFFWFLTGKTFKFNDKKSWIRVGGLIQPEQFSFNTVDGFRYGYVSTLSFKLDSFSRLNITPWVGYAFSRKSFMGSLKSELSYGRKTFGKVGLHIGSETKDFSNEDGMPVFMNTIYSLFLRENYKKFYNSKYVKIYNGINISKTVRLNTSALYEKIDELNNYSDYSFFYENEKEYTPNIRPNADLLEPGVKNYRSFVTSVTLTYNSQPRFLRGNYRKNADLFPKIELSYDVGIAGIFNSNSKFNRMSLGFSKEKWLPRDRYFEYKLKYTYWLTAEDVYFSNYSHVKNYDFPISLKSLGNTYQFLPFYTSSTNDWLVEAHLTYSTKLLFLKRLPIISNKIWNENIYLNYLQNEMYNHHLELGYSVGQIWAIGEIGVFTSFDKWKYSSTALKICIGFEK